VYRQDAGYYQSCNVRTKIKESGKEQILTEIKKGLHADFDITEFAIDSLNEYDRPVTIRFNFNMQKGREDIVYFNPMLGEAIKENPFGTSLRTYPVEMPWTIDETYALKLELPIGYIVDELPQEMVLKLNEEGDGSFEYRLSESNGIISLLSRIRIRRTFFLPEEYDMIREFYNAIVKKHSELIVLKKQS
jgi:hypothetical protein